MSLDKVSRIAPNGSSVHPVKPLPEFPEFLKSRSPAHRAAYEEMEGELDKWRKTLQAPSSGGGVVVVQGGGAGGGTSGGGAVGQRGPQGLPGDAGADGIQGPIGPAGGFTIRYIFSGADFITYLTEVARGKLVSYDGNTSSTSWGISVFDKYGVDLTALLATIAPGDSILIFDEDNPENYVLFKDLGGGTGFFNATDWFWDASLEIHNGLFLDGAKIAFCVSFRGPSGGSGGTDGRGYLAASTTSIAIGTGSKTITINTAVHAYSIGARVRLTNTADVNKWMEGVVTAVSGSSITFLSDLIGGTGTLNAWDLNLAGERGIVGATGSPGSNGATGSTGPAGATGAQGIQGIQGIQGLQGPAGQKGDKGDKGDIGDTGPVGPSGPTGADGKGYFVTSTTSLTISTGSKLVVVNTSNHAYVVGARFRLIDQALLTNWMEGPITAVTGTSITFFVQNTSGSGTKSAWFGTLAGEVGGINSISCRIYFNGTFTNTPNVGATIPFNTLKWSTDQTASMWASGNPERITCRTSGYYIVGMQLKSVSGVAPSQSQMSIRVTRISLPSTHTDVASEYWSAGVSAGKIYAQLQSFIWMDAGDYIDVYINCSSAVVWDGALSNSEPTTYFYCVMQ